MSSTVTENSRRGNDAEAFYGSISDQISRVSLNESGCRLRETTLFAITLFVINLVMNAVRNEDT